MGADGHVILVDTDSIWDLVVIMFLTAYIKVNPSCSSKVNGNSWTYDTNKKNKFKIRVYSGGDLSENEDSDEDESDDEQGGGGSSAAAFNFKVDLREYKELMENLNRAILNNCSREISSRGWDNVHHDNDMYVEVEYMVEQDTNGIVALYYYDNIGYEPGDDALAIYFEDGVKDGDMYITYVVEFVKDFRRYMREEFVEKFETLFPDATSFVKHFTDLSHNTITCSSEQIWT